jgi:pantetheine-phosphate adenylyltransferase
MKVALGGTFEPLHEGHKALIDKAIELGGENTLIGVTSDEMARKRLRSVLPFHLRAENVRQYIKLKYGLDLPIIKLRTPYGTTLEEDFDYLVVSPETYPVGEEINQIRVQKGLRPITVVKVDFVFSQDGKPISATRIKNGEIDRYGVLLCD